MCMCDGQNSLLKNPPPSTIDLFYSQIDDGVVLIYRHEIIILMSHLARESNNLIFVNELGLDIWRPTHLLAPARLNLERHIHGSVGYATHFVLQKANTTKGIDAL